MKEVPIQEEVACRSRELSKATETSDMESMSTWEGSLGAGVAGT